MSAFELTCFGKASGVLTKRISLEDGKLVKDGSRCAMAAGGATRVFATSSDTLAQLIASLKPHHALGLGVLRDDLPEVVDIVTDENLKPGHAANVIARTKDFISYRPGIPAWCLIDYEGTKDLPSTVHLEMATRGGFWHALCDVIPNLFTIAHVRRGSTSSGLYNTVTGERFTDSGGQHIFLMVADGSDNDRFLKDLSDRLWLIGLGFYRLSKSGALLDRSLIDCMVGSPERLIFEAGPELIPPVAQDQRLREPVAIPGGVLYTRRACPPLTDDEQTRLAEIKAAAKEAIKPEAAKAHEAFVDTQAKRIVERTQLPLEAARQIVEEECRGVLRGEIELVFDDGTTATVAQIIDNPAAFIEKSMPDPIEGVEYGRGKAKLFQRDDGSLMIHSFAHGERNFELKPTVQKMFEEALKELADKPGMPAPAPLNVNGAALNIDDFWAYLPAHKYICTKTGELWPPASVNSHFPLVDTMSPGKGIQAGNWLDKNRPVHQLSWVPGKPELIEDHVIRGGALIAEQGTRIYNLYRPPTIKPAPGNVSLWRDHIARLYEEAAEHIELWFAHRVQRPGEKVNHGLALGGPQGIGKDSILEAIKRGVGAGNFSEVSPQQLVGRFNSFLRSVILRVSELRDNGDVSRYGLYEHCKALLAAPPDVLRVDEKNIPEYSIPNVLGMVFTTNHRTNGLYLPPDDRRHFVCWSQAKKEDFDDRYWNRLWQWYENGGFEAVAHYLHTIDLSRFDPKAPPPKTQAFWDIVDAGRAPEDSELADVLDRLGRPSAVTMAQVIDKACSTAPGLVAFLNEKKNRGAIPHRFEACEYVAIRNQHTKDGFWVVKQRRQVIYARTDLSRRDQFAAASALTMG